MKKGGSLENHQPFVQDFSQLDLHICHADFSAMFCKTGHHFFSGVFCRNDRSIWNPHWYSMNIPWSKIPWKNPMIFPPCIPIGIHHEDSHLEIPLIKIPMEIPWRHPKSNGMFLWKPKISMGISVLSDIPGLVMSKICYWSHGPVEIVDLPIEHGDFPVRYVTNYQAGSYSLSIPSTWRVWSHPGYRHHRTPPPRTPTPSWGEAEFEVVQRSTDEGNRTGVGNCPILGILDITL